MYYGAIKDYDIANGPGVRVSLFVSGCRNHCKGCFQPETWAFDYGKPFTEETKQKLFEMIDREFIDGLSVLGGDPLEPENVKVLTPFLAEFRKRFPDKTVWLYTGYRYEDFRDALIMKYIDVLVDGKFIEELKNPSLAFRGSENQRIIKISKWEGF